ncbi:hypothetical protein LCGC14_0942880 [marine sediment metagenome]|uniref:Alkaline phosphatase n=2 Tax=root TaxID=1 RepID=A0A0F9NP80_9ZZZZ
MFFKGSVFISLMSALFASKVAAEQNVIADNQLSSHWYIDAVDKMAHKPILATKKTAKNVILFVGDGMGISTITAARILDGQLKGQLGEENNLSFERFPFTGLAKTYNVDAQTPDSAGTMTAIMTGVKTDAGIIGIDENVEMGVCSSMKGNELITALELAEIAGKSTGIVTTTRVTHATPAATYAKSVNRDWEDNSDLPASAIDASHRCSDIATQLIEFETNLKNRYPNAHLIDGIEVVMGGGRRHFLPMDSRFNSPDAVSKTEGDRTDGRNLISEWQQTYPSGVYVYDQVGFDKIKPETTQKVLALFNESNMHYEVDRKNDIAGEPSLSSMTEKALKMLSSNKRGFFLMVEAGRIDHAHHAGSAYGALTETIELSKAVNVALENTDTNETLIIVTADHSHVFTMAGYPKRGNPILGKVVNIGSDKPALAEDGKPYTTLGYANGLGLRDLMDETDADKSYLTGHATGREDISHIDTESPGYHQESLVPLDAETHGGEDVAIYATGPGASAVMGVNEQNVIYHIINQAANLQALAQEAINESH